MGPEKLVHFNPYSEPEEYEYSKNTSRDWAQVTCPECLRIRSKLVPALRDSATVDP